MNEKIIGESRVPERCSALQCNQYVDYDASNDPSVHTTSLYKPDACGYILTCGAIIFAAHGPTLFLGWISLAQSGV